MYEQTYTLKKRIGSGAFAEVWLANVVYTINTNTGVSIYETDKKVAIKITKQCHKYIKYIKSEIEYLSYFTKSKYVSNMIEHFNIYKNGDSKEIYIVLEYLGQDLFWLIENFKKYSRNGIPIKVVKKITRQLLYGLIELKTHGIIHTDLKPENILLSQKIKHKLFNNDVNYMLNKIWNIYI